MRPMFDDQQSQQARDAAAYNRGRSGWSSFPSSFSEATQEAIGQRDRQTAMDNAEYFASAGGGHSRVTLDVKKLASRSLLITVLVGLAGGGVTALTGDSFVMGWLVSSGFIVCCLLMAVAFLLLFKSTALLVQGVAGGLAFLLSKWKWWLPLGLATVATLLLLM